jgi:hypothetical protein
VAQALGAALYEHVDIDAAGRVSTRTFRQYHLPQFADVPPTEVHFAVSQDPRGPLGAKPMSEAPFNPVAPALANAVRDATGRRLTDLPLTRDRVFTALNKNSGIKSRKHWHLFPRERDGAVETALEYGAVARPDEPVALQDDRG